MKALVVYESMFGNTRQVAEAVAAGLRMSLATEMIVARDTRASDLDDVQLVVVGAPTHAWGLSRRRTRDAAALDATNNPAHHIEPGPLGPGVREWLLELKPQHGRYAVAFDTRFDKPRLLTGSASRPIQRGLRKARFATLGEPHSFTVRGTAGPLVAGEIERARQWGEALGRTIVQLTPIHDMPEKATR
jgi:hypothetical protein